jgi:hypothetical protein
MEKYITKRWGAAHVKENVYTYRTPKRRANGKKLIGKPIGRVIIP